MHKKNEFEKGQSSVEMAVFTSFFLLLFLGGSFVYVSEVQNSTANVSMNYGEIKAWEIANVFYLVSDTKNTSAIVMLEPMLPHGEEYNITINRDSTETNKAYITITSYTGSSLARRMLEATSDIIFDGSSDPTTLEINPKQTLAIDIISDSNGKIKISKIPR